MTRRSLDGLHEQGGESGLLVEIWSDVVCPWCYIGKRRFEKALERFPHRDEVRVLWRSFQLDPTLPRRTPGSVHEMLARKLGRSVEEARQMNRHVTELAAAEGLEYRLDEAKHGNTFDAHRLIHLAGAEYDLRGEAKERLLRGYFGGELAIGEADDLIRAVSEVGVDADRAHAVLGGDEYSQEVRYDERRAQVLGVQGVPFFVFAGRYGVSGAQPAELLLQALERVWRETQPDQVTGSHTS